MKTYLKITISDALIFFIYLLTIFLFKNINSNFPKYLNVVIYSFSFFILILFLILINKFFLTKEYEIIYELNKTIENLNYTFSNEINPNFMEIESSFRSIFSSIKIDILNILIKEGEIKKEKEKAEELSKKLSLLNKNLEIMVSERTNELLKSKNEAEYANKMKDEFLAKVSHEMRTPLTPIIGYSRILKKSDSLPKEILSKLEIIHNSGLKLLNFTNELLDFTKIITGKIDINYEKFDTSSLFNDIYYEYKELAEEKNIDFKINIEDNLNIYSDRMKIYEISKNIIHNAIKYTEHGFVIVDVKIEHLYLKINVHDSGIGIDSKDLGYIFQSFGQINKHSHGVGLGLSIVNKLIDILNGNIKVISELGVGSSFKVAIPINIHDKENSHFSDIIDTLLNCNNFNMKSLLLKSILRLPIRVKNLKENYKKQNFEEMRKVNHIILGTYGNMHFDNIFKISENISRLLKEKTIDSKAILAEIEELELLTHTLDYHSIFEEYLNLSSKKLKILIAEDVEENRDFFKILLETCPSINVITAENGIETLKILKSIFNFDFIFLDIQMPLMNGIETLQELKKNKNLKNIPTIALTAQAILGDKEKYLPYGFDFYITKPINESVLFSCLELFIK